MTRFVDLLRPSPILLALLASCGGTSAAPSTCALSAPVAPDWRLRADGTLLRDGLGRVVFLRGVNMGGRSKLPPFSPFDYAQGDFAARLDAYLDRAAAWGIDVARVPFTWEAVEPTEGADDAEFLGRYDALLDAAWKRGIWTIIDFHQDVYAQIFCGDGFPAWTVPGKHPPPHHDCPMWSFGYFSDAAMRGAFDAFWAPGSEVQAKFARMWDRMVARHAQRPGVLGFEVINEPGWGTAVPDVWSRDTLTPFFTKMAARIHAAAPAALVFFEPNGVDGIALSTQLGRPDGEGLVFAPHYYQATAALGGAPNTSAVIDDLRSWADYGKRWNVPVLVGEFGAGSTETSSERFMRAHFDALDATGIHGTEWEYSVSTENWNGESLSLVSPDGTEYPIAGAIVRAYPRAVAGADVTFAFDAAARSLSLRYTPAPGITEVTVPVRAYPAGFDVSITGGCYDSSHAGRLLVQATVGARAVDLRLTPR